MVYKCLDCGHVFEDGEQNEWEEVMGEFEGIPYYEKMSGCPMCKGYYSETKKCKICGTDCLDDDFYSNNSNICINCAFDLKSKYKYDYKSCFRLSQKNNDKESVSINGFIASMFTEEEINKILLKELEASSCSSFVDCSRYIYSDESWFIENAIKEEVKK